MVNLFSLTKTFGTKGAALASKGLINSLNLGTTEIFVDKVFKHGSGRLFGIEIHPTPKHIAATS
jgi:hypothetical protein